MLWVNNKSEAIGRAAKICAQLLLIVHELGPRPQHTGLFWGFAEADELLGIKLDLTDREKADTVFNYKCLL